MGIYVFNPEVLRQLLEEDKSKVDFGRQIIPSAIEQYHVQAHLFNDYWEDIGTIRSFYQANMDLTMLVPKFNLYDPELPIYTRARFLPPAKIRECRVHDCLIAEGSILSGAELIHTVVGIRTRMAAHTHIERTIIMGADYYQSVEEIKADERRGIPPVGIGEHTVIKRAIIDKNARIGRGVRIENEAEEQQRDAENYYIRDGIVIVPKNNIIPDGTVI
jgi:glucose-1-phosphate adenylyltransferase